MGEGQLADWLDSIARPGGVVSALEAVVTASDGAVRFHHVAGHRVGGERLEPGARFDAASLTKPWMATLALALDRGGDLRLDTRLGGIYPRASPALAARTLEDLLRHRAGLPAWTALGPRLGRRLPERAALEDLLTGEALAGVASAGAYSDLGYLLWGLAAERVTGRSLAELLDRRVASPLGLGPIGELAAEPSAAVECRLDNGREVELARAQGFELALQRPLLRGRPQDGNARLLGRLSAHAGLFLTAGEGLALAREWLRPSRLLSPEQVDLALSGEGAWALGWARADPEGSSGPALGAGGFGHAGFTGGSLWIDREAGRVYLLLAHRLSSALDFNPYRREFHRLAAAVG
jgi:CubicO group peptidase (beta-lactamase class C family)